MLPPPPRRGKTDHFYAWLVESNPEAAGKLRRESHESSDFQNRLDWSAASGRSSDPRRFEKQCVCLRSADALVTGLYCGVFTRQVAAVFKNHRDEYIKLTKTMTSAAILFLPKISPGSTVSWPTKRSTISQPPAHIVPPEKYYTTPSISRHNKKRRSLLLF